MRECIPEPGVIRRACERRNLAEEEEMFGATTMDLVALFPADEQYLLL